ncbi:MAG TPA: hypothetical protein VGV37_04175 [Aliidongia sp.]|uniref:hypothetical protein n=1 Tax=Aliidongia sp. TaxID=1914230 RepID=UPI002DDCACB7|nr:hypothetical protein [Aliidongia sp.]HEV2673713.1 hypothetical protein [Aliidongia sp.]
MSRPYALSLLLLLAACSPAKPIEFVVHQSTVVADAGKPAERRIQILEDARFTPAMRAAMWGGSKDSADFLTAPGVTADAALKKSFAETEPRRALVRLTDAGGKVLAERQLDCELAAMGDHALPQAGGRTVWAVGNDCSTGDGLYAGLITRFVTVEGDKFVWQRYVDAASRENEEMTLVQAARITWHLRPKDRAESILEVSCHPDFTDPRFQAVKPGEALPADLPDVVDYIRYRADGQGGWVRQQRTVKGKTWDDRQDFPPESAFPG